MVFAKISLLGYSVVQVFVDYKEVFEVRTVRQTGSRETCSNSTLQRMPINAGYENLSHYRVLTEHRTNNS